MKAAARGSFAEELRFFAQRRACAIWNVPALPRSFNEPVSSNVPVLMIDGSDDPATPPRYAEEELPYLTDANLIVCREPAMLWNCRAPTGLSSSLSSRDRPEPFPPRAAQPASGAHPLPPRTERCRSPHSAKITLGHSLRRVAKSRAASQPIPRVPAAATKAFR